MTAETRLAELESTVRALADRQANLDTALEGDARFPGSPMLAGLPKPSWSREDPS